MEFGHPPGIEFTRVLGCVGEAARGRRYGGGGGSRSKPNQTKPNRNGAHTAPRDTPQECSHREQHQSRAVSINGEKI